jgi:hypothetical protein
MKDAERYTLVQRANQLPAACSIGRKRLVGNDGNSSSDCREHQPTSGLRRCRDRHRVDAGGQQFLDGVVDSNVRIVIRHDATALVGARHHTREFDICRGFDERGWERP